MLKRCGFTLIFTFFLSAVAFGMGLRQENKIPIPAKSFTATVIDRVGVSTTGENVSIEGNTFVKSIRGRGTIYVDFSDILKIQFGDSESKELPVTLTLKNGKQLDCLVLGNDILFGFAMFGKFKIQMKEIQSIEFSESKE
jgi:hypothetical protein